MMPEWGPDRQELVSLARVAVVGAGGVKASLLMALASGGIGFIRIIEFDVVELSNLNRQCLYATSDIGHPKGECATTFLRRLNPDITVEWSHARLDSQNAAELIGDVDFIVEGGDSPHGRNALNEFCLRRGKPFVHASAQFSYGYVFSVVPEWKTACFACFFPNDHTRVEPTGPVPVNVLSVQVAGSLGAAEVFKWVMGHHDEMHVNRRLCFSSLLLSGEFELVPQARRTHCPICEPLYAVPERKRGT